MNKTKKRKLKIKLKTNKKTSRFTLQKIQKLNCSHNSPALPNVFFFLIFEFFEFLIYNWC